MQPEARDATQGKAKAAVPAWPSPQLWPPRSALPSSHFSLRTWLTWDDNLSFNEISHFNEKNKTMTDATHPN